MSDWEEILGPGRCAQIWSFPPEAGSQSHLSTTRVLVLSSGPWALPQVRGGQAIFCGVCQEQGPLAFQDHGEQSHASVR